MIHFLYTLDLLLQINIHLHKAFAIDIYIEIRQREYRERSKQCVRGERGGVGDVSGWAKQQVLCPSADCPIGGPGGGG